MPLNTKLQADLAGEEKAIKDYSERIKQAKGKPVVKTLEEILRDEKDHHRRLLKALDGLRGVKPKEKEPEEEDEIEDESGEEKD